MGGSYERLKDNPEAQKLETRIKGLIRERNRIDLQYRNKPKPTAVQTRYDALQSEINNLNQQFRNIAPG